MRNRIILITVLVLISGSSALWAQTVDFGSLLEEMVTRSNLAEVPEPYYTCRQASSYDRGTKEVNGPGWFANMDRSFFIRDETNNGRKEFVLMDADGPGSVVRFWGTWHGPRGSTFKNGTLRVYLDGNKQPTIEGPIRDIVSGGMLVGKPLSMGVSPETEIERQGHNLYMPIPYAKHCKVTYESDEITEPGARNGEALYYQIDYRTYDKGTPVKSFTMDDLTTYRSVLARVLMQLSRCERGTTGRRLDSTLEGRLEPGQKRAIEIARPGAIREISIKLNAEDLEQAFRSTVITIDFDGTQTVWCPVGDFFGTGHQLHPYRSWYSEVSQDGSMSCFWVMPFEKNASVAIHNLGEQPVDIILGEVRTGRWNWDDRSQYFHAGWHLLSKVSTRRGSDKAGDGAFDVNYVEVKGAGTYVGDQLCIFNGSNAWWGEGDEKIFVDGEAFPSHIGTGTEDYYGYAWCRGEYFAAPFHAQPCGEGNNQPKFSENCRWRGLDAIPFKTSLKFDMELWHWHKTQMNFAPTAMWYARPGSQSNRKPEVDSAQLPVAKTQDDVVPIYRVKGALEGEALKILEKSDGTTEAQGSTQWRWSGQQQLWWKYGKPGDELVLALGKVKAGRYRVKAGLTKAKDYAIIDFAINNKTLAKDLDLYHPDEVIMTELELGDCELKAGENRIKVTIKGCHPDAVKSYMFGLDYLLLEPIQ